jgi:galactokinase
MPQAPERRDVLAALRRHTGEDAEIVARAPGRVNLIGEHTDYNDGFVLPMALPHATWMAARRRDDDRIRLWSEGHPAAELSTRRLDQRADDWSVYVQGVARVLGEEGIPVGGFDAALATDIPVGASLSSSAALELVAALVVVAFAGAEWDPVAGALASVRAEREHVGMPCGVMDQLICATAVADHASLIDCRTLEVEPVPLPADAAVVVLDTGTRRQLVDSAYADRRAACERVAQALGVEALRDVTAEAIAGASGLDATDRRRAGYVVAENERTIAAADAMRRGDTAALGGLMDESHRGLRDGYEVSGPALDAMVEAARDTPGCVGARMTGGGFAGCAVALVERDTVEDFVETTLDRFRSGDHEGPAGAAAYPSSPGAGASLEQL